MGGGGVLDSQGEYIIQSGISLRWISFGGRYDYDKSKVELAGEDVIWFGFFYNHWGHFLLDFLSRMWWLKEYYNGEEIVYVSHRQVMNDNFLQFFELLGVDKKKIKRIDSVTKFEKIIIPEYAKSESYYSNEYLDIFSKVIEEVMERTTPDEKARYISKKIYLSRSVFNSYAKKEIGEEKIEDAFKKSGYEIVYPEKMTLIDQVLLWNNAKEIACINGTIPLNLLLSENEQLKLVVLNKTNLPHQNLQDVLQLKGDCKSISIDVFDRRFLWASKNIGDGPFVLNLTPQLIGYLGMEVSHDFRCREVGVMRSYLFVLSFKIKKLVINSAKYVIKKFFINRQDG